MTRNRINRWTIGSSQDCDIVIDDDSVAQEHCELLRNPHGHLIRIFDPTNDVFVDDERVADTASVTPESRIVIGKHVKLPWPSEADRGEATEGSPDSVLIYQIGRSEDNEIVLARPMVSGHHANLMIEGDRLILEDIGSTNGTAVGNQNNRIKLAEVTENDLVFFGSFSIMVRHLLAMVKHPSKSPAAPVAMKAEVSDTLTDHVHSRSRSHGWMVAATGAVALLLIGATWFWYSGDREKSADRRTFKVGDPHGRTQIAASVQQSARLLATLDEDGRRGAAISHAANGVFAIVVLDDQDVAVRVGTGWLASPSLILTTGDVAIETKQRSQNNLDAIRAVQSSSGIAAAIEAVDVDSRFASASSVYADGRKQYRQLLNRIRDLRTETERSLEAIALNRQAQQIVNEGIEANAKRECYNIGWLRLSQPLADSAVVQISESSSLEAGDRLHMHAAPIDVAAPRWQPGMDLNPHGVALRFDRVTFTSASEAPSTWKLSMKADPNRFNYVGSPIVDMRGQVVAMFSEPAIELTENDSEYSHRFEAVSLRSISDVLAEIPDR